MVLTPWPDGSAIECPFRFARLLTVVHIKSLYPSAIFWIESFGVSGNSESLGGVLATISPPTEVFALINNRRERRPV
jgi:hypothetical protein